MEAVIDHIAYTTMYKTVNSFLTEYMHTKQITAQPLTGINIFRSQSKLERTVG
jgi:hypothetical protein